MTCSFLTEDVRGDGMYVIMLHQTVVPTLWGDSFAGFGETSYHAVSCLWRGPCGRELGAASSPQPEGNVALGPVAHEELNAVNKEVSLDTDPTQRKPHVRPQPQLTP